MQLQIRVEQGLLWCNWCSYQFEWIKLADVFKPNVSICLWLNITVDSCLPWCVWVPNLGHYCSFSMLVKTISWCGKTKMVIRNYHAASSLPWTHVCFMFHITRMSVLVIRFVKYHLSLSQCSSLCPSPSIFLFLSLCFSHSSLSFSLSLFLSFCIYLSISFSLFLSHSLSLSLSQSISLSLSLSLTLSLFLFFSISLTLSLFLSLSLSVLMHLPDWWH